MALSDEQKNCIQEVIKTCLRNKFKNYKPETNYMPFHHALLGKDRMALFSFIHSLNTTFGSSIFEPVTVALSQANSNFKQTHQQFVVGNKISELAQREIQHIINELSTGKNPNKEDEIARIRKVCQQGNMQKLKTVKVDLYLETKNNEIHLFDLKTAKPNQSNFKDFKRTLLEWIAIILAERPNVTVHSYVAIPYNPYYPEPYQRWTLKGMLDDTHELKVAEEFWDYLGGTDTFNDLLHCFELAGMVLKPEIDDYFNQFVKQ
ncbi:TdeIII family type II restriction endonuclease [Thioflexithrix psekupsensis]|uniref:type II site-specific deoxyribonuclease n=1 Tax=Thioflexithrix psekupsensis TaxID=1570016 RepID=A0A251X5F8_9GAMM|nr:TdeIII family type II restriction endonuclease [Thioflexithrix psekupsensis]OUD12889.1 restriction endonuclease [Thioflexithrix psekupsensis]